MTQLKSDLEFRQVAIIGGGMGGPILARILQQQGVDAVIFERDTSPTARPQGGSLDIHGASGQWALKEAGLEKEFHSAVHIGGEDLRILNKDGTALLEETHGNDTTGRPEVDRPKLRNLLLESLGPNTIRWNHKLVSIESLPDKTHHLLQFENGASVMAGLVVGADGASSKVRSLVTSFKPLYSGVSMIEYKISDADEKHPEASSLVGYGNFFALADNKGFIAHRNSEGHLYVYVSFRTPNFEILDITFDSPSETRNALLKHFSDWSPEISNLIAASDNTFIPRAIAAMPTNVSWSSQQGLTLIGDAAHLMSPFAGEGVNMAMQDGAELALELLEHPQDVAIKNYETKMLARAQKALAASAAGLEMCLSENGSVQVAQMMAQFN
jgi:2-polyprenyl-6-methoxyphenol hydroxylase-like FAD-dependent oxidoreductase